MADTKISALSATTTLDAADEFPLNDSGTTKKITAANLAAQLAGMLPLDAGGGGSATNIAQGATGASGSAGGATGATGTAGVTGPQGLDGIDGADGPPGPPGMTGATGAGVTGATGPEGVPGLDGARGSTGPAGLDGVDGIRGATGPTGPVGLDGLEGRPGATGSTGQAGLDGVDGIRGASGATGPEGMPGLDGGRGFTGATGPEGTPGLDGRAGVTGATGTAGVGIHNAYALLREEQASGVAGGTFTSGAWQTRVLNTESFDPGGIVTLLANQFTLQAGTYFIHAKAPAIRVDEHKAKLANISDVTDVLIGTSDFSVSGAANAVTYSFVTGRFTIASAKVFEIQHRCTTTQATNGFGTAGSFGVVEVYAEVEIWREA